MVNDSIVIKNARTHNLKGISLNIPKRSVVVFTGVSGSGKSSLVFDTIFTEAQRQLIETFSSFARARMPKLSRPPIDEISGISTAIVIDQKRMGTNMRSTVGTATELYTYLRLLFSRCGDEFIGPSFVYGFNHPSGMCPDCKGLGKRIKIDIDLLIDRGRTLREGAIDHPDHKVGGWNWRELVGSDLFDMDKPLREFTERELHDLLYAEAIPIEKVHGAGTYAKNFEGIARKLERLYLNKGAEDLNNERREAYNRYITHEECGSCGGSRINAKARNVRVGGRTIPELVNMELTQLFDFLSSVDGDLAEPLVKKMSGVLSNLICIGVGFLTLNRPISTLSGGESQRLKMARQLDCDLVDMMYILDEPSIGLHPRDIGRLTDILSELRMKGNTVLVVEHDPEVIRRADHVIDIGPGAGVNGGNLVYQGDVQGLLEGDSLTGRYLQPKPAAERERRKWSESVEIVNAVMNNLQNVSTRIPSGVLTCITGVAGSGKISLMNHFRCNGGQDAIVVDQGPIGRSSRSNPATYTGVFNSIRKVFADANDSDVSLFSFNSEGACPKCQGLGFISHEMSFLDDVREECDECNGRRYLNSVLELTYRGKNISDVLGMTVAEAIGFFDRPDIVNKLKVVSDVGLDYLELGQPLSTLSGGECQRIKLASELKKKGRTYILDEPTTGLHMADIDRLMRILDALVDKGNTVVVIEHNMDVIHQADWVIDLGPEGGRKGGRLVFEGTPEDLMSFSGSHTGRHLRDYVMAGRPFR